VARLGLAGEAQAEDPVTVKGGLARKILLPEVPSTRESEPVVLRFTPLDQSGSSR
jgi:hypothetical protein